MVVVVVCALTCAFFPLASSSHFGPRQQREKAAKMRKVGQRPLNYLGRAGEADRHHQDKMPKHLFTGKRGKGTHDRR